MYSVRWSPDTFRQAVKLPTDHIYVILIAFLAVLGCFTTVTLVGTDPSAVATLRDALIALGGGLTGVAVGSRMSKPPDPPA